MKSYFIEYLGNEKMLFLAAALIGLSSIAVAVYFLVFQPWAKSFGLAMLILGMVEAGILSFSYFRADKRMTEKIAVFENNRQTLSWQKNRANEILNSFFFLKLLYASVFLTAVLVLSRVHLNATLAGILLAIMIHAGMAATIDSFGEQYTKKYLKKLEALVY